MLPVTVLLEYLIFTMHNVISPCPLATISPTIFFYNFSLLFKSKNSAEKIGASALHMVCMDINYFQKKLTTSKLGIFNQSTYM